MAEVKNPTIIEKMRKQAREIGDLTGNRDTTGIELIGLTHLVARTYDMITMQKAEASHSGISRARWGLLMRLWREEKVGNAEGLTPTYLSQCQNVGKNTISALLRGLEEQGLVQRTLDRVDHRIFRIQLTQQGRKIIADHAPRMLDYVNRLASGLSEGERAQLRELLSKLYYSLLLEMKIPAEDVELNYHRNGG
ncbi:MAG TPA: MarR family transcriptional regulator [Anaerolineaceae bacterium]|nr:MarR family transcriptional regulator [Anaerolineaceae bacterium]